MSDTEAHLKKFEKELAAGTVSLVLLAVLAAAREPLYGYQIAKRLEGRSAGGVLAGKQSALYPVLRNLSAADCWIPTSSRPSTGRRAAITASRRWAARCCANGAKAWTATRRFVESVLKD